MRVGGEEERGEGGDCDGMKVQSGSRKGPERPACPPSMHAPCHPVISSLTAILPFRPLLHLPPPPPSSVPEESVLSIPDVPNIYHVPLLMLEQNLHVRLLERLGLDDAPGRHALPPAAARGGVAMDEAFVGAWKDMVHKVRGGVRERCAWGGEGERWGDG